MQDFGAWKRPAVYLRDGETRHEAAMREARTVRTACGLLDYSPLGKIEVHGPDALDFLNRFYINDLTTLKQGRARYGLMLRESGVIFADDTVVMLAADRFVVTTTSGNAKSVAAWFEEWHQCEWPHLRVAMVPVTESWACFSIAGPKSRDILAGLQSNMDLSTAHHPHLGMREGGERPVDDRAPDIEGDALGLDAVLETGAGDQDAGLDPFLGEPVQERSNRMIVVVLRSNRYGAEPQLSPSAEPGA